MRIRAHTGARIAQLVELALTGRDTSPAGLRTAQQELALAAIAIAKEHAGAFAAHEIAGVAARLYQSNLAGAVCPVCDRGEACEARELELKRWTCGHTVREVPDVGH